MEQASRFETHLYSKLSDRSMINIIAERTPKSGPSSRGGLKANMIAAPTSLLTDQNIPFIPTT